MDEMQRQAGYVRGLVAGLKSDPENQKVLEAITELIGIVADRLGAVEEMVDDMNDYVESIDDDLCSLENDMGRGENFDDDLPRGGGDVVTMFPGHQPEEPVFDAICICGSCGRCFRVIKRAKRYVCPLCGEVVPRTKLDTDMLPFGEPAKD